MEIARDEAQQKTVLSRGRTELGELRPGILTETAQETLLVGVAAVHVPLI